MLVQSNTPQFPSRYFLTLAWEQFKRIASKANTQFRQKEERAKAVSFWDLLQKSSCADFLLQSSPLRLFQKSLDNNSLVTEHRAMSLALFIGRASIFRNNKNSFNGQLALFSDSLFIAKGKEDKSLQPVKRIPIQDISIIFSPKPLKAICEAMQLSLLHSKRNRSISQRTRRTNYRTHRKLDTNSIIAILLANVS